MFGTFKNITTIIIGLMVFFSPAIGQNTDVDSSRQIYDMMESEQPEPEKIKKPRIISYNFEKSLHNVFLSDRLSYSRESARSFQHDAGDFLKLNPSNLVISYHNTPVRTNVSPYALPGNRMNIILDSRALHPIEHLPEPDNMIDFNDIPTAPVQKYYNLEGPLGIVFGGNQATSSLVMLSHRPDSTRLESRLVVDKGSFGYAYTKGSLYHTNEDGRSMRLALGYRKADGIVFYADDDAYHHWAEFNQPLAQRWQVNLGYRLYKRDGSFPPRFDTQVLYIDRFRRDRDLIAGVDFSHSDKRRSSVEFRHQRSESKFERRFKTCRRYLDIFSNSLTISHEGLINNVGFRIRATAAEERFDDKNYMSDKRRRGEVDLSILLGDERNALTVYVKGEKVSGFDPAPSCVAAFIKNAGAFYMSASAGYCTVFPRQYEMFLTPKTEIVYDPNVYDYFESGNPNITPEKQLIGNISFGLGKAGSDLMLSATGGKIFDGIDWRRYDTLDLDAGGFTPYNHDIEFVNGTIRQRLSLWEKLIWTGGASYHYLKMSDNDDPTYAPEYQGFTGLELYHYIETLDLHLYAYGELLYAGPYNGYNGEELGEDPVFNLKLTFRVKKFRFYYIFQDMPSIEYRWREDYTIPGRYNYYGITWEFLD